MKRKVLAALFTGAVIAAMLPATAFAASITNSISASPSSSALGSTVTVTQRTVYAPITVGGVPIPFVSDFRTEIPSPFWARPSNISSNTNCGSWGTVYQAIAGEYMTGPYHYVQGANQWFASTTTWTLVSSTSGIATHSYTQKMVHGQQESDSAVSQGSRATVWTQVY